MLKEHEKLRIPDENKLKEMVWEVNWNPKDKKTNECKYVRVHFPDKSMALVKKEYLMAALFALGTAKEQRDITPKVQRTSRHYETVVSVTAKQDIKKGQSMTFPLKLTLPTFDEEVIAEAKRDVIKGGLTKLFNR